jgi:Alpha galactosidase A
VRFPLLFAVSATACFCAAPMGWNSWNSFANIVNSEIVQQQAKALASNGLKEAGYEYVVIDEGWWLGERDAAGNIVVNPKQWPAIKSGQKDGDMANIADYIHSLGLKAGIYTDAGRDGCSMYPDSGPKYMNTGSEGHYEQDFLQFSKWGFDYVKVDWCGGA